MDSKLVYAVALVIGCWVLAVEGLKINSTHPVGVLNATISRDGCGKTKVCVETPEDCDPSADGGPCLFTSGSKISSKKFYQNKESAVKSPMTIELRGYSDSYIFLSVTTSKKAEGKNAFICAQYNQTSFFFTGTLNNGTLTVNKSDTVSNVLVSFNGNTIRCRFTGDAEKIIKKDKANKEGKDQQIYVFAGNGSFSNGLLGDPVIILRTNFSVDQFDSDSDNASDSNSKPIPVAVLNAPISRANCGRTKTCLETPANCDPASNGSCLFVSAKTAASNRGSGTDVTFELRGETPGYTGVFLSRDSTLGGNDTSYICARNNKSIQFFTATIDNGALTRTSQTDTVRNVQASLNGNVIQCTFTAVGLNATATRATSTSFDVFAGTGNFTNGILGNPTISLRSNGSLDLTSTSSSSTTNTTTTSATTNDGPGLYPTPLVLLVLLSALIFQLV